MKRVRWVWIIVVPLLPLTLWWAGCSKKEPPAPPEKVEMPPEKEPAPEKLDMDPKKGLQNLKGGYLPTVVDAYTQSKVKLPLIQVTAAVQNFKAMEGRYPDSLEELETWQGGPLPKLLHGVIYTYEPTTGEVGVARLPE